MTGLIYWQALPLDDETLRIAKIKNVEYEDALRKNLTAKFFQRLKIVAQSKLNLIMSGYGLPGSGKSYEFMFIIERYLKYTGKMLPLKHCAFYLADLVDAVEEAEKGDIFLLDEQVLTSGLGSGTERKQLENIEMTVRKHKLSLFFLAPQHIKHGYHFYTETWEKGALQEWDFTKPLEDQWTYTKSILCNHKDHKLGYIITGPPTNLKFLKEYEAKKDKFIEAVKSQSASGRPEYIARVSQKLLADKAFIEMLKICKTKKLMNFMVARKLGGKLLAGEELKGIVDELEYNILLQRNTERTGVDLSEKGL